MNSFFWLTDWLELRFWRVAIWVIRRGYGADCATTDLEDFGHKGEMYFNATANDVFAPGRCASCRARETIDWIEKHIKLIES